MFDPVNNTLIALSTGLALLGAGACALAFVILLFLNLWTSVFDPRGAAMIKAAMLKIALTAGLFGLVASIPAMFAAMHG